MINTSIFCHIQLDSELNGRFGVQGNTFTNTFGYLEQYFLQLASPPADVEKLRQSMTDLVMREEAIKKLSESQQTISTFANPAARDIMALREGNNYLLPGGWQGIGSPGHAMIYQFEREASGTLLFSIYNAGSGIDQHEKVSSEKRELYSPVKAYRLPQKPNEKALIGLIKKLILPQLTGHHPERNQRDFDAEALYGAIETSLPFLDAQQLPQDLNVLRKTTAGQLSGTCSQRSIHQMLKINFNTLPAYQKFIIDFKVYALKDFIATHPVPRSPQIAALIDDAIKNNLKIVREPDVFTSPEEKNRVVDALIRVQQAVLAPQAIREKRTHLRSHVGHYRYRIAAHRTEHFESSGCGEMAVNNAIDPMSSLQRKGLLQAMEALVARCHASKNNDPLWVLETIEQAVLQLPLPERLSDNHSFYSELNHPVSLDAMGVHLEALQTLYTAACKRLYQRAELPHLFVIQCSLLALRDYMDTQQAKLKLKPSFHFALEKTLSQFLSCFQTSPHLANNDPRFDQRLKHLMCLYRHADNSFFFRDDFYLDYYQALLNTEPALKKQLAALYRKQYEADKSELHVQLRISECTELYYLFTHLNALNPNNFGALIKKIQRQIELEQFFVHCFNPLIQYPHGVNTPLNLELDLSKNLKITTPAESSRLSLLTFSEPSISNAQCIVHHKYNLAESKALDALLVDYPPNYLFQSAPKKLTANKIQLAPNGEHTDRIINQDDFYSRELFHLRTSPRNQINFTLDYFTVSLHKLADPNIQGYVEANIFEPGLLCDVLDKDPDILTRFDSFIHKGLRYFADQEGLSTQTSLFFIRLNVYLNSYVARYKPAYTDGRLKGEQQRLSMWIAELRDPAMLASLHTYRFLAIMAQFEAQRLGFNDAARLDEAFVSYCYMHAKSNPERHEDTASRAALERTEYAFKRILQVRKISNDKIKPMLLSIGLEVRDFSLEGRYPLFTLKNNTKTITYTVNAQSGYVFNGDKTYRAIPLDIQQHVMMRRLGLAHESSCFLSPDGNTIEFITPHTHVRMKKRSDLLTIVQKKWTLGDKTDWYELTALTQKQHQLCGLGGYFHGYDNQLPAYLTDGSMVAWASCGTSASFIARDNHPIYQKTMPDEFEALDKQGRGTGYVISDSFVKQQALVQFESLDFFSVHLDKSSSKGVVNFMRYDVCLEISDGRVKLLNTNYRLDETPVSSPFGPQVAALQFVDGEHRQCMVAVQRFYRDTDIAIANNKDGEYYALKHDTSGHIPQAKLKKHWEDLTLDPSKQPLWFYEHSGKTITYTLVDGEPRPDTAEAAFYLCYLYLAQHEVDKAWCVLDALSCEGTLEELTYLSWIVQALPVILSKEDEKSQHATPRYVACQLKALACYTNFLAQDKTPNIPSDTHCNLTRANGHYEALCLSEVKAFYEALSGHIYTLYATLQHGARHLDERYDLSFEARKSLLTYYDATGSEAQGALGYEQRRLSLTTLLTEKNHLLAVKTRDPKHFPPNFSKRLKRIDEQLEKQLPVMKKSTLLELKPIDLSLPPGMGLKTSLLAHKAHMQSYDWISNIFETKSAGNLSAAIQALGPDITQDEFIQYFPHYAGIARDAQHPEREVLRRFCVNYLIGHCHTPLDKQDSNIPYLANVLYRFLHNPNCTRDMLRYSRSLSLSYLTCLVQEVSVPDIQVYQAQDVFQETLATSQELWDTLKHDKPRAAPMKPSVFELERSCTMDAMIQNVGEQHPVFKQKHEQYHQEERAYQEVLRVLDPSNIDENEKKAGDSKYACIQAQRRISELMLDDSKSRHALLEQTAKLDEKLEKHLTAAWSKVFELAHQAPRDAKLAERFRIELAASMRHQPTKKELLMLYLRADYIGYVERTGLSREACDGLHALIHRCIAFQVEQQHAKRLMGALNAAGHAPSPNALHHIAAVLMSENIEQARRDPGIMLFQYETNMLLRPRQVEALNNLLSTPEPYCFNEVVEKIIMGGGKSKVILPLLAAKKATGLNLVVVEVPRALLATNHVDLNYTSRKLFGQKAHKFEFNRDSKCSPERLEAIYQQFVDIMTHQDYLVTTGESMQSLELKYLELLLSRPEQPEDEVVWKQQIHWASQITQLLKQCGDVMIDEVHQGLLFKKKLNYTLGDPQAIAPDLIRHSIALYQFLEVLNQEAGLDHPGGALQKNMPSDLDDALLNHTVSPLQSYIKTLSKQYGGSILEELKAYLNNAPGPEAGACLTKLHAATPALQEALAFYKEQLSLLPQTRGRHHKEHYGPSKAHAKSALQRALAIPYAANEKPNERSRFGNALETINYTVQSTLLDGLNKEMLVDVLIRWQTEARHELQKNPTKYTLFDRTPTAEGVGHLLLGTGLTLCAINHRNKAHVDKVFNHVRHNKSLLFSVLEAYVLKQITVEPAILHSDAYNHMDIYHSRQGISGTPSNYLEYHQSLQYNHHTAVGTDGYIQAILRGKKTPIHGLDFTSCHDFLPQMYAQLHGRHDVRAIMDISATFTGLTNVDVAEALAAYAAKHQPDIYYILYFDDKDVLYALDVKQQRAPIPIEESDPVEIERKLHGCKPENRFTYYDQAHTLGADINQATNSCGLVLVDEKTPLSKFLQGCMRMRGLENNQTVEIVVPSALTEITLDTLMDGMLVSERNQLRDNAVISTLAKMDNCVRNDVLQRLASVDDLDTKIKWAEVFEHYFIEKKDPTLFKQYGGLLKSIETHVLFKQHLEYLINDWTHCLGCIEHACTSGEITELGAAMQSIIDASLPHCEPQFTRRLKQGCSDLEVEVQQEQEILKEQEKLEEEMRFDPTLKEMPYCPWDRWSLEQFPSGQTSLIHCCGLTAQDENLALSKQLFVTKNYAQVYEGQKDMLGFYLKPVHAILFRMRGPTLTACLVSNQEAEELSGLLLQGEWHHVWLSTTQHTCLAGNRPKDIWVQPDYQILMEQIRLFSGDCNALLQQTTPFLWLKENTNAKFAWFKKRVMPYRETTPGEFSRLQAALSKKTEGFEYIDQHACDDLSDVDWEDLFPDALPGDRVAFSALAAAYADANKHYRTQSNLLDWVMGRHTLVPAAVTFLKGHVQLLMDFSSALNVIELALPDNIGMHAFSAEQRSSLQRVLYIDINSLLKRHHCDRNTKPEDVNAQLSLLDLLMALIDAPVVSIDDRAQLVRVLEKNPLFENMVIKKPVTQEHVLLALLGSKHKGITVQHFEQFQAYKQTRETGMAQLNHRHLTVTNVEHVTLDFSADIGPILDVVKKDVRILAKIITQYGGEGIAALAKKYLSVSHINTLIQASLDEPECSAMLGTLIEKDGENVCKHVILSEHQASEAVYQAVLSSPHVLSAEQLQQCVTKVKSAESLDRMLAYPEVPMAVVLDIMKHAASTEDMVVAILEDETKQAAYNAALDRLTGLIENSTVQRTMNLNDTLVERMIQRSKSEYIFHVILERFNPSAVMMPLIISKAKTEATLLAVVKHKNTPESLYSSILKASAVTNTVLQALAKKAKTEDTLQAILQKPDLTDPVVTDVIDNALCTKNILELIFKDETKSGCYNKAVTRLLALELPKKQQKTFMSLVDSYGHNEAMLHVILVFKPGLALIKKIAAKATGAVTLKKVIEAAGRQAKPRLFTVMLKNALATQDETLFAIFAGSNLTNDARKALIKQTTSKDVLTKAVNYGESANPVFAALRENTRVDDKAKAVLMVAQLVAKRLDEGNAIDVYLDVLIREGASDGVMDKALATLITTLPDVASYFYQNILAKLNKAKGVGNQTYEGLFSKKISHKSIPALLIKFCSSDKHVQALLQSNLDLTEAQLKTLLPKARSEASLKQMINYKTASKALFSRIILHPECNKNEAMFWAFINKTNPESLAFKDLYSIIKTYLTDVKKQEQVDLVKAQAFIKKLAYPATVEGDEGLQALQACLDKLWSRGHELIVESLKCDRKQEKVCKKTAKDALALHAELAQLIRTYANTDIDVRDTQRFSENILNTVNKHKSALEEDPGMKEILYEILNIVLKFFSYLIQKINPEFKIGFFESRTRNKIIIDDIENSATTYQDIPKQ